MLHKCDPWKVSGTILLRSFIELKEWERGFCRTTGKHRLAMPVGQRCQYSCREDAAIAALWLHHLRRISRL